MKKLSFKDTQLLKLITDNIRFMEKLERQPNKVKRPNLKIFVLMNKLSDQDQIKDIVNLKSLLDLPKELISFPKFRFKIVFKSLEREDLRLSEYLHCPLDMEKINQLEKYFNNPIAHIKVEFEMKYDAASEENQRKWDKQQKKESEEVVEIKEENNEE